MSLQAEVNELKDIMHGMLQKMKEQQRQIDTVSALMCAPDIKPSAVLKDNASNDDDGTPLLAVRGKSRRVSLLDSRRKKG